ncbi:hypothetical protein AAY473_007339, partial [Plecturocebus cupreus]
MGPACGDIAPAQNTGQGSSGTWSLYARLQGGKARDAHSTEPARVGISRKPPPSELSERGNAALQVQQQLPCRDLRPRHFYTLGGPGSLPVPAGSGVSASAKWPLPIPSTNSDLGAGCLRTSFFLVAGQELKICLMTRRALTNTRSELNFKKEKEEMWKRRQLRKSGEETQDDQHCIPSFPGNGKVPIGLNSDKWSFNENALNPSDSGDVLTEDDQLSIWKEGKRGGHKEKIKIACSKCSKEAPNHLQPRGKPSPHTNPAGTSLLAFRFQN